MFLNPYGIYTTSSIQVASILKHLNVYPFPEALQTDF